MDSTATTAAPLTLKPIGFMRSVFHYKNATPRQSSLCENARGYLTIDKSVFNNPEHSLQGLEDFSHAWVLFIFHKNNNAHTKAKVKPPRLDGQRVGVFSTRSPYRPNNIGLSLLKIDKIQGATIHFSGVDILDGSPIIDIKPYIPQYDQVTDCHSPLRLHPETIQLSDLVGSTLEFQERNSNNIQADTNNSAGLSFMSGTNIQQADIDVSLVKSSDSPSSTCRQTISVHEHSQVRCDGENYSNNKGEFKKSSDNDVIDLNDTDNGLLELENAESSEVEEDSMLDFLVGGVLDKAASQVLEINQSNANVMSKCIAAESASSHSSTIPENSETLKLKAEKIINNNANGEATGTPLKQTDNAAVTAPWLSKPPVNKVRVIFSSEALAQLEDFDSNAVDVRFRTQMLSDAEDARKAITSILHEEPRSVYRRKKCQDSVYFFALDVLHVTCWFDGDDAVTVLRVKPVVDVPHLVEKESLSSTATTSAL